MFSSNKTYESYTSPPITQSQIITYYDDATKSGTVGGKKKIAMA